MLKNSKSKPELGRYGGARIVPASEAEKGKFRETVFPSSLLEHAEFSTMLRSGIDGVWRTREQVERYIDKVVGMDPLDGKNYFQGPREDSVVYQEYKRRTEQREAIRKQRELRRLKMIRQQETFEQGLPLMILSKVNEATPKVRLTRKESIIPQQIQIFTTIPRGTELGEEEHDLVKQRDDEDESEKGTDHANLDPRLFQGQAWKAKLKTRKRPRQASFAKAEELLRNAFLIRVQVFGLGTEETKTAQSNLFKCYLAQGKRVDANEIRKTPEIHCQRLLDLQRKQRTNPDNRTYAPVQPQLGQADAQPNLPRQERNCELAAWDIAGKNHCDAIRALLKDRKVDQAIESCMGLLEKNPIDLDITALFHTALQLKAEYPRWHDFQAQVELKVPRLAVLGEDITIEYSYKHDDGAQRMHPEFDRIAIFKDDARSSKRDRNLQNDEQKLVYCLSPHPKENKGKVVFHRTRVQEPGDFVVRYLVQGSMFQLGEDYPISIRRVHVELKVEANRERFTVGEPICLEYEYGFCFDTPHDEDHWIGLFARKSTDERALLEHDVLVTRKLVPSPNKAEITFSRQEIGAILPGTYRFKICEANHGIILGESGDISIRASIRTNGSTQRRLSRHVRVLLLSPVLDFTKERSRLRRHLEKTFHDYCTQLRVSFSVIDVLAAIDEAHLMKEHVQHGSNSHLVPPRNKQNKAKDDGLETLFYEIDQCRPHLMIMFGERYGWVPNYLSQAVLDELPWIESYVPFLRDGSEGGKQKPSVLEMIIADSFFIPVAQNDDASVDHVHFFTRHPVNTTEDLRLLSSPMEVGPRNGDSALAEIKARILQLGGAIDQNFTSSNDLLRKATKVMTQAIAKDFPKHDVPTDEDYVMLRCEGYANLLRKRETIDSHELARICSAMDEYMHELARGALLWKQNDFAIQFCSAKRDSMVSKTDGKAEAAVNSMGEVDTFSVEWCGVTVIPKPWKRATPTVLVAPPGYGKSKILVRWLDAFIGGLPDDRHWDHKAGSISNYANVGSCCCGVVLSNCKVLVLACFMGAFWEMNSAEKVIRYVMIQAKQAFGLNDFMVPVHDRELVESFSFFLQKMKDNQGSLLLLIDNIDLLLTKPLEKKDDDDDDDTESRTSEQSSRTNTALFWLPEELDPSVLKIIATCIPEGEVYQEISHRLWNKIYIGGKVDASISNMEGQQSKSAMMGIGELQLAKLCFAKTDTTVPRGLSLQELLRAATQDFLSRFPGAGQVLCLVRCSSTGLTEFEVMQMIGAGKSLCIIDELQWSQMRKAMLQFALMEICGKMVLQGPAMRSIVDKELLRFSREKFRKYTRRLVDYFTPNQSSPWNFRQAEEFPPAILKLKESSPSPGSVTSTGLSNNGGVAKSKNRLLESLESFLFSNYSAFVSYWFTEMRKPEMYAYIKELDCKFSQILQQLLSSFDQTFNIPPIHGTTIQTADNNDTTNAPTTSKPKQSANNVVAGASHQEFSPSARLSRESKEELPRITSLGISTQPKRRVTIIDNTAFAMSLSVSSAPPTTCTAANGGPISPSQATSNGQQTSIKWSDHVRYENFEVEDLCSESKERGQALLYELRTRGVLYLAQLVAFCAETGHLKEAQSIAESAMLTSVGIKTWDDLELALSTKQEPRNENPAPKLRIHSWPITARILRCLVETLCARWMRYQNEARVVTVLGCNIYGFEYSTRYLKLLQQSDRDHGKSPRSKSTMPNNSPLPNQSKIHPSSGKMTTAYLQASNNSNYSSPRTSSRKRHDYRHHGYYTNINSTSSRAVQKLVQSIELKLSACKTLYKLASETLASGQTDIEITANAFELYETIHSQRTRQLGKT